MKVETRGVVWNFLQATLSNHIECNWRQEKRAARIRHDPEVASRIRKEGVLLAEVDIAVFVIIEITNKSWRRHRWFVRLFGAGARDIRNMTEERDRAVLVHNDL